MQGKKRFTPPLFVNWNIVDLIPEDDFCCNGKRLKYKSTGRSGGYLKKRYLSSRQDCAGCPLEKACADKRVIKKVEHTIYREEMTR